MPDLEALGDAVTGAALAGAVEPRTGRSADGHTDEANCLNCGTALTGEYCRACGQHAHVHRTLAAFFHDIAHGVLHFDGKIWRTLPLLAWHPGDLTRRYIAGERARFVSPMALFLFSVFLMFAVFSMTGGLVSMDDMSINGGGSAESGLAAEQAASKKAIADLQQKLAQARAGHRPTAAIESHIAARQSELAVQQRAARVASHLAKGDAEPAGTFNSKLLAETGWPPLDRAIVKAEGNPSLLLYKVQNNAYKFSWALIPISLPFLWLLFLHRRRYRQDYGAYDHLIFVTYSIAFMSLGAIVLALLRPLGVSGTLIGWAIAIIPPVHVYRQLKGAYQLSRWSAAWRTLALLVCAFAALTVFLVLLLLLGVFG
ncbi:MAG: DUF3667 domain-containing protein [Sphingomicrobium sp.]